MIGCIQIGTTTVQGRVVRAWSEPVRAAPSFEFTLATFATIDIGSKAFTGRMIPRFRARCDECRQEHGKHLDWCPDTLP